MSGREQHSPCVHLTYMYMQHTCCTCKLHVHANAMIRWVRHLEFCVRRRILENVSLQYIQDSRISRIQEFQEFKIHSFGERSPSILGFKVSRFQAFKATWLTWLSFIRVNQGTIMVD